MHAHRIQQSVDRDHWACIATVLPRETSARNVTRCNQHRVGGLNPKAGSMASHHAAGVLEIAWRLTITKRIGGMGFGVRGFSMAALTREVRQGHYSDHAEHYKEQYFQ